MTFAKSGLGVFCIGLLMATAGMAQRASQALDPRFAIRAIDDTVDGRALQGTLGEDRVPNSTVGIGMPGVLWLEREGGVEGQLAEAHVGTGADGQPVVLFTLTPKGRDQFAALTRASIGHRIAIVVNGAVVTSSLIGAEMAEGKAQISGYYTDMEASALAAEMIGTISPAAR